MNFKMNATLTHLIGLIVGAITTAAGTFQTGNSSAYIGGGLGLMAVSVVFKLLHDANVTPAEILAVETKAKSDVAEFLTQSQTVAALVGKTAAYDRTVGDVESLGHRMAQYEKQANDTAATLFARFQQLLQASPVSPVASQSAAGPVVTSAVPSPPQG